MGFLSGLFGGGDSSQTTTTENAPWGPQQQYLLQILKDSQNLYNSGKLNPQLYPDSTIAPQSAATQQSQQGILDKAQQGSSLNQNAYNMASDTLGGKYLDVSNLPGFKQGLQDIKDAYSMGTAAQTDSAAARTGNFGGSAYNEIVGRNQKSFADSLNTFAGNVYNNERQNQLRTAQMAPYINELSYDDLNRIGGIGQQQDVYNQAKLDEKVNRFNTENQAPLTALNTYKGLVGTPLGSTSTSTTSGGSNGSLLGNVLGFGGLALSGLGGGGGGVLSSLFGGGNNLSYTGGMSTPWKYPTINGLPWLN